MELTGGAQDVWLAVQWTGNCALPTGCFGVPVSTLEGAPWRLLSPDTAGDHWDPMPSLAATVWTEPLDDCPSQTYGSGCPGTGGFVPQWVFNGCPAAGETFDLAVVDILGGTFGYLLFGTDQAAVPIGNSGCMLQVSPLFPTIFTLPVGGVGPGAGVLPLPAPFPIDASGWQLTVQMFFADPATPFGRSSTGGLEILIP